MKRALLIGVSVFCFSLFSSSAVPQDERNAACLEKDSARYVTGGKECLAYKAFGLETAGPNPALVVFLHGAVSAGGAADYMYTHAARLVRPGLVNVALLRPEYFDKDGHKSTGSNYSRRDNNTAHNVDAIADAIGRLKSRLAAKKVFLVGHSAGAVTVGVILGRHPNLVSGAMLVSCPCILDYHHWDQRRGPYSSLSPHVFVEKIPQDAQIIVITGDLDTAVRPDISKEYARMLSNRGIRAEYREIPGGRHGFSSLTVSPIFSDAFALLVRDVVP